MSQQEGGGAHQMLEVGEYIQSGQMPLSTFVGHIVQLFLLFSILLDSIQVTQGGVMTEREEEESGK